MAELKTKENNASVSKFISSIKDKQQKEDSLKLLKIFQDATNKKPKMWGNSIIGFGKYHYKSERSSQEGDWMMTAFSPRKQAITLYIMSGFEGHKALLKKLGKYKLSSGCCMYVKKLEDINVNVLKQLIKDSCKEVKKRYAK